MQAKNAYRKRLEMKNRKLKMIFAGMMAGMMVMGSTAYTFAAEETTESAAESTDAESTSAEESDADEEIIKQLAGCWHVNAMGYMFMPDGQVLDSQRNHLCDYKIEGDKIVWDLSTATEDVPTGAAVEMKILPMDTSKLGKGFDAEYYYVGNDDKMLEIHAMEEDNSDPMNPETKDSVNYTACSIADEHNYYDALLRGYTWQTDNGSLAIAENGDLDLNQGAQTGNVSFDNDGVCSFAWTGNGVTNYQISSVEEKGTKIVLEKVDDSSKTIVLTNREKIAATAE